MTTCIGAELQTQHEKVRRAINRLIDSYAEGLIEKSEFEPRIKRLKQRAADLEKQTQELTDEQSLRSELHLIIGQLEDFAKRVEQGMDTVDLLTRREIIRALARRIEVDSGQVSVVFKVSRNPFALRPVGAFCNIVSRVKTIRTARSRTSGEYLGTVFMTLYPLKIWSLRQTWGGSVQLSH